MAIDFSQLQYVDLGQRFMQGLQQAQQAQQEALRQQQAQARAQQMQQAVAAWRNDMTPQRTADLLLQFPEIKEQITAAQSVLSDAAKQDRVSFASKALMLARAGQGDRLKELAAQRAGSYRAAGDEQMAQEIEAQIKLYDLDPKAIEGALALDLAQADLNLYKTVFAQSEKTAMEKQFEAIAARNGPEAAKAWWDAQVTKDKLVTVPGIGVFKAEDFTDATPENLPRPTSAAERDALPNGTRYIAPNGQVMVKGGSALAGIPAPQLNANGIPNSLTPQQYQATVASLGKVKTDEWMRQNNITVSGQ